MNKVVSPPGVRHGDQHLGHLRADRQLRPQLADDGRHQRLLDHDPDQSEVSIEY